MYAIRSYYVTTVSGGVSNSYGYSRILNSNGVDIEDENPSYSARIPSYIV